MNRSESRALDLSENRANLRRVSTPAIRPESGQATQFKPGQSGNPSGRPKGIAARARALIGNDPGELLEVFLSIARDPSEKAADRRAAAEALLDRAYGKAPTFTPVDGDPLELSGIDSDIAAAVDELARKRKAPSVGEPANGAVEATG